MEQRRASREGPDDAVDQWTPGTDDPRQGVLHRITTVSDNRHRLEVGEGLAQPQGEARLETLGDGMARRMLEDQVELHLGWSVEKAEEPVADLARLVELVDQDARRMLGAPAPRPRV